MTVSSYSRRTEGRILQEDDPSHCGFSEMPVVFSPLYHHQIIDQVLVQSVKLMCLCFLKVEEERCRMISHVPNIRQFLKLLWVII